MNILKILFILLLIIFPLAEIGRVQFSNGVAVSLNDMVLFLTIIAWLTYKIVSKTKFKKPILYKEIAAFSIIAFVALLFNFNKLNTESIFISFLYLVRWVFYALLYFIVLDFDIKFKNLIMKFLFISGFITVIAGYMQFFLYPNLKNLYYLGWDDHLYRMFSTFLDPNFAGAFFVIYFLFTLFLASKHIKEKIDLKVIIIFLACGLSLGAVYLTYSRGAFLMLLVGILSFLWLKGKRKVLLGVFTVLILLLFLAPKSFKLEGTNFLRVVSTKGRIASMQQGINMFLQNPVLGVGFNSYRYALNRDFGINNQIWKTTHAGAGNDNSYIFILATTGVIGFFTFCLLLLKLLTFPLKNKQKKYAIVLFPIVLALFVNSLFINSLFYVLILEWVWILTGLTESN